MTRAETADPRTPLQRLRALHAEGRLADEYENVRPLLAEIAVGDTWPTDMARAGQLLTRLEPDQLARDGRTIDPVRVAVTGHSTLGNLIAPLAAEFGRHGLLLQPTLGEFGGYERDLRNTDSILYTSGAELALCILDAQIIFDELAGSWGPDQVAATAAGKLALLDQLVGHYVANGSGSLVINTVPLQHTHVHQLIDYRARARLGVVWREFNAGLLALAAKHSRVIAIDLEPLFAAGGPVNEPRLACYAKAFLGDELLARYAREIGHVARTVRGRAKKVLVVDLDNTMWDGILSEDGPDGIAAATTFRGEAFGNFQRLVKQIGSQGVLLAVSSKNDQDQVLKVLGEHADMAVRAEDFARINANWNPKDANIRDIAQKLNLGLDSFVFVDDSPTECGVVRTSLPGVAVVQLDEEPALHIERLLSDGWFDALELTQEDVNRTAQYRAESARQDLMADSESTEDYLRALGVAVTVSRVKPVEIARIAQLTLRTNQFNLTTQRWQPADVVSRVADPDHLVLSIRSADRFGDNGVVGALFARRVDSTMHIDNMLLSCRVFDRGIEQATLATVLAYARDNGATAVHASYRETAKNKKVRDFYPSLGFARTGGDDAELAFRHDLAELPSVPDTLSLDSELERPRP